MLCFRTHFTSTHSKDLRGFMLVSIMSRRPQRQMHGKMSLGSKVENHNSLQTFEMIRPQRHTDPSQNLFASCLTSNDSWAETTRYGKKDRRWQFRQMIPLTPRAFMGPCSMWSSTTYLLVILYNCQHFAHEVFFKFFSRHKLAVNNGIIGLIYLSVQCCETVMDERSLKTRTAASGQVSVCLSLAFKHPDVWSHLLKAAEAFVSWRGDWVAHGNTYTNSTGCAIHLLPTSPFRTSSFQELLDQYVFKLAI